MDGLSWPGDGVAVSDKIDQVHRADATAVGTTIHAARTLEALRNGPKGALFLSAIAVGLLLLFWLAFYFLIFMSRGPIG